MSKHRTVGIGAACVGVASIALMTVAMPVLVLAGLVGSGDPLGGAGTYDATGIPPPVAGAYQRAADAARAFDPPCEVPAPILAGVGEVETGHGTHGGATTDVNGNVAPPIIGPPLPHLGGDTDDGTWDGDNTIDHAVGPMQFIPTTWRAHALDGNDDGATDPHNIFDAALTAAAYLCANGGPMATEDDWRRGLYAYNHSDTYIDAVLTAARSYQPPTPAAVDDPTGATGELVEIPGIGLTSRAWADQVRRMLAAAAADGLTLTGSSYRDPAQQIALRRAHCGTSHYAVHEMPASQCSPPTARPGTSNHERGLAIDFHNCGTHTTRCYQWLAANAATFGIFNLPSESWHWSANGN